MITAFRLVTVIAGLALAARSVAAPVDCANPDNLCTGDPCVIPALQVASPCVVDFGPRTLILAGRLRGTPDATISLTAASITVERGISVHSVLHVPSYITLAATTGDIMLNGRLASSTNTNGDAAEIVLDAAGDVVANAGIRDLGYDPRLSIHAGGDVILRKRITNLQYLTITAGNAIEITGLVLSGFTTMDAGGTLTLDGSVFPGVASLSGAAGVTIRKLVSPATLHVTSSGGDVDVDATARGPQIRFRAPSGNVTLAGRFAANVIEATAGNDLTASARFDAGCIALVAGGTLDTTAATFTVPPVPDCPGSPSGAFVDGLD